MAPATAKHPVTEGSGGRDVGALIIKYCARGHACDTVERAAVCTCPHVEQEAIVSVVLPKRENLIVIFIICHLVMLLCCALISTELCCAVFVLTRSAVVFFSFLKTNCTVMHAKC